MQTSPGHWSFVNASTLHTWLSRAALRDNNKRGIFDNLSDTEPELRELLSGSFGSFDLHVVGSVAVFAARLPAPAP